MSEQFPFSYEDSPETNGTVPIYPSSYIMERMVEVTDELYRYGDRPGEIAPPREMTVPTHEGQENPMYWVSKDTARPNVVNLRYPARPDDKLWIEHLEDIGEDQFVVRQALVNQHNMLFLHKQTVDMINYPAGNGGRINPEFVFYMARLDPSIFMKDEALRVEHVFERADLKEFMCIFLDCICVHSRLRSQQ